MWEIDRQMYVMWSREGDGKKKKKKKKGDVAVVTQKKWI